MEDFWEGYQKELKDGYFKYIDDRKSLKPEFIVEYPRKIALQLKDSRRNKLSQLWKFYDYARRIQDSLRQNGERLDIRYAQLCKLQPAVNYAKGKDIITQAFKDFIDCNVDSIRDDEDLHAFIEHFQSVIAYLPRQNQK